MSLLKLIPFEKSALTADVLIMLTVLFMWIGAEGIYGPYAEVVRNTMIIYFFLFLIPYTIINKAPRSIAGDNLLNFPIGFIGTGAILFVATQLIGVFGTSAALTEPFVATITIAGLGFGVLHAFVKAYIEESVFRWALPKYFKLGDIISNIIFGIFHLSILLVFTIPSMIAEGTLVEAGALNWTYAIAPVITLIILGLAWSQVRDRIGIIGATGSHTAWNMFALGILPRIFLGGIA